MKNCEKYVYLNLLNHVIYFIVWNIIRTDVLKYFLKKMYIYLPLPPPLEPAKFELCLHLTHLRLVYTKLGVFLLSFCFFEINSKLWSLNSLTSKITAYFDFHNFFNFIILNLKKLIFLCRPLPIDEPHNYDRSCIINYLKLMQVYLLNGWVSDSNRKKSTNINIEVIHFFFFFVLTPHVTFDYFLKFFICHFHRFVIL